ncbi:MAG: translation initiation factor IF-2 [Pirellulales bacterium]
MPVRIYALAKELKLDSKKLVDICAKAGVSGKGSALASLTDDEAVKVKAFLSGGDKVDKGAPSKKATPVAPVQPLAKPKPPTTDASVVRREDYIAPAGVAGGKMPMLGDKPIKKPVGGENAKTPPKTAARVGPAIKLAPLPPADQPAAETKPAEPTPQKPDLKLPADAIRASKAGSKPLAAHLRRHEKERQMTETKRTARPPAAKGGTPTATPPPPGTTTAGRGRRGKGGGGESRKDEDGKPLLGGREQRQLNRKRSRSRPGDEEGRRPMRSRRIRRTGANTAAPRKGKVALQLPCTVRTFSEATGVPSPQILRLLLAEGVMANVNTELDPDITELVAAELGVEVELKLPVRLEDQLLASVEAEEDDPELLQPRPPVITFLGHVDHGKTSLLDHIIGIDVVSGESGGITQHIRAYQIEKEGRQISFVDTPGHEAFTEMRARGANVTDIAVLVVAADDGVMPQTEEAINHARAAGVPIVVALNKIDLPGIDINRVMQQLSANELLPSEWGGDVEVIKTSATTGEGMDELLETLLTVSELNDYRANPKRAAYGTCLEAQQEGGRGVVGKLIVQNGTLRVGDVVVCGAAFGRAKALYDTLRPTQRVDQAGPSVPVSVTGFDVAPAAGDRFYVLNDIAKARQIAETRATEARHQSLSGGQTHVTLENLFERLDGADEVQTLHIILRADVRGSIEAIEKELSKLDHPEVKIRILQKMVGGITEADVHLADASDAIIIGFNVVPDEGGRLLADRKGVQIRRYDVIYKVSDDIRAALEGMLKPEEREVDLGRALVQQTYTISRVGTVAGCRVLAGTIQRNSRARVIRNNTVIGDYRMDGLKREKDDVREVREGMECGIKLVGFDDIKDGDIFEVYRVEEVGRKFDT